MYSDGTSDPFAVTLLKYCFVNERQLHIYSTDGSAAPSCWLLQSCQQSAANSKFDGPCYLYLWPFCLETGCVTNARENL